LTEQRGDASRLLRSGRHHREPLFHKVSAVLVTEGG
jgi:hypothetical protein